MNYNQGGFNGPPMGGYHQPQPNSYSQDDATDFLDFDVSSIDPNAEPWEIAQRLTGSDRDIGSGQELQRAFNQAQSMPSTLDANSARGMFDEASTTSRGGGGTSFSTKLIAGAAGWAAMSYYQSYQKKQGHQVNHAFIKKMVAGIAMAQAIKMYNKQSSGGSGFMGFGGKKEIGASRDVVAAEAASNAMKLVDDQLGADQKNSYGGPPPMNNNSGGYGGPPSQNYGSQGSYGGPPPNQNFNSQGSYSGPPPPNPNFGGPGGPGGYGGPPPPVQGYGGPGGPGGFGGPPQPQQGGNFPQPSYGGGPPNMNNNGPPSGYPNQGGPPPYNPGPGGFFRPNMP